MALRIAWATEKRNTRLGIAAQIFVAAGTVILYLVNIIFAQRIIRAQHPRLGWHKAFAVLLSLIFVVTMLTLALLITSVIQSAYTLSASIHRMDRDFQLYGTTAYAVIAFLPILLVLLSLGIPRRARVEKFGLGRFRTKVVVLITASALLCLGASYRAGIAWLDPAPATSSPWYFSKACFYIFNFTIEALVVFLYAIFRVDRRFHIPDGASGPGSYSPKPQHYSMQPTETQGSTLRIYNVDELFEDASTLAESLRYLDTTLELDAASGKWRLKRQSRTSLYSDVTARDSQPNLAQLFSPLHEE